MTIAALTGRRGGSEDLALEPRDGPVFRPKVQMLRLVLADAKVQRAMRKEMGGSYMDVLYTPEEQVASARAASVWRETVSQRSQMVASPEQTRIARNKRRRRRFVRKPNDFNPLQGTSAASRAEDIFDVMAARPDLEGARVLGWGLRK